MSMSNWRWPILLAEYDRHPELSEQEKTALSQAVERMSRFQTPLVGDIATNLHRLTRPLEDALNASDYDVFSTGQTVNFILHQMCQRQTTYWIWTEQDWSQIARKKRNVSSTKTSVYCIVYLLGVRRLFYGCGKVYHTVIANRIFGTEAIATAVDEVDQRLRQWGYCNTDRRFIENAVTALFLLNGDPNLSALSYDLLDTFREICPKHLKRYVLRISKVLADANVLKQPLQPINNDPRHKAVTIANIAPEWVDWSQRWRRTATMRPKTKQGYYYILLHAGRWLNVHYPHITSPAEWTREMALEFVIHIQEYKIGDLTTINSRLGTRVGKPLRPQTQTSHIGALRAFFRDCLEWGWITLSFDPLRYLHAPYTLQISQPNPRIISDDMWAKLLWAGLNLQPDDLPVHHLGEGYQYGQSQYPFEMIKALALVWLFGGLRKDEIRRLRVGCVRWQSFNTDNDTSSNDRVCLLDVPVNKTGGAFTKPISYLAGEAIETWEAIRPKQPAQLDSKTNERVHFLFIFRAKQIGNNHLNEYLIPLLCRKANLPQEDIRGKITSHRARSTIASQLANAREPMSLLELMQWLGHSSAKATQHYVKLTPNKLTQAYTQAGYFDRNLRTISVLLDQEAIRNGTATTGIAWKYYDLGHGYCSYDFFDQCPHRMACAKCTFYIPKASSAAQLLEAKTHLQRMLQQIPLTEAETAAVEEGVTALEQLQMQLLDVSTPSGQTPREMQSGFVSLKDISMSKENGDERE